MSMESVMPSYHLILLTPLLLPTIFPSIRVSSNELALHIRWPKCWSFIFSISLCIEYCSTTSKTKLMFPITEQYWTLIKFNRTGMLFPEKSQNCSPAFLLPFSEPGIELFSYSFSCLKRPTNLPLSAIQKLFLPPSPKISACSLIVLCTSIQRTCYIMLTSCYIMVCSTPGFPVHHQLSELAQTHVHQVGDATQQFCLLSSPLPPAFNLSQLRGLF